MIYSVMSAYGCEEKKHIPVMKYDEENDVIWKAYNETNPHMEGCGCANTGLVDWEVKQSRGWREEACDACG